jgi:hypothetical protein
MTVAEVDAAVPLGIVDLNENWKLEELQIMISFCDFTIDSVLFLFFF